MVWAAGKEQWDPRVRQDRQGVPRDLGDPQVPLDHEDSQGQRGSKGFKVVRGFKVSKVQLEP